MRDHLIAGKHDTLINYLSAGEDARLSVPTPDHYLPLLYVIAQQQAGRLSVLRWRGSKWELLIWRLLWWGK